MRLKLFKNPSYSSRFVVFWLNRIMNTKLEWPRYLSFIKYKDFLSFRYCIGTEFELMFSMLTDI